MSSFSRSIHFPDAAFAPSLETSTSVRILPGAVGCIVMCTCRVQPTRGASTEIYKGWGGVGFLQVSSKAPKRKEKFVNV